MLWLLVLLKLLAPPLWTSACGGRRGRRERGRGGGSAATKVEAATVEDVVDAPLPFAAAEVRPQAPPADRARVGSLVMSVTWLCGSAFCLCW